MRRFRFVWLAIASAPLAAAAVHGARAQYGGTLRVETRANVHALDPTATPLDRVDAAAARRIESLVFDTLTHVDPAGGLRPRLATSWESDRGGARWRFHLRPGVALHDGTALEAWQVAAALRAVSAGWSTSIDGDAVLIESQRPRPELPWELADARFAVAVRRSSSSVVGTGPFRLERIEASRIILRAHDACWSARPFLDAIEIMMGRAGAAQLTDLESNRADIVDVSPADARRLTDHGLRVITTRPLQGYALVFEPHKADAASDRLREMFAGSLDRSAIANVLLQGRAEPAVALLPSWVSGYPEAFAGRTLTRTAKAADRLPPEQRTVSLRVDSADPVARLIGDRIAVDAREVGFTVTVQAPAGLAPRPDVRLVRITLDANIPTLVLARLVAELGPRALSLATAEQPPPADAPLAAALAFERALLQGSMIVPVVRVPDLYGLADGVEAFSGEPVDATGTWNFANVSLHAAARSRGRP